MRSSGSTANVSDGKGSWPARHGGHVAAFALCAAFVIGIACWGGVRAGWQFEEDYEIFSIHDDLRSGESFASVAARYMVEDQKRIRLYYWIRTLQVKCFGFEIAWYRWCFVLLGVWTFYLAYRWSRFWGLSWIESMTMPLLLFGGSPMNIWWRMGTAENTGMFFFFAALVVGCRAAVKTGSGRGLWDAVFVVCVWGMSLSKESFLSAGPAVVFLKLWFEAGPAGHGWRSAIRRNGLVAALAGAMTAAQMAVILGWTGTTVGGYIGVDGFSAGKVGSAVRDLWGPVSIGLAGGSLLLAAGCVAVRRRGAGREALQHFVPGAAVAALMTVSAAVLFQKTGIHNHYELPGRFAVLLVPFLALRFLKLERARFFRVAVLALVIAAVVPLTTASLRTSRDFWNRSETVRKMIDAVRSNTRTDDAVVSVLDLARQREWSRAMKTYWERLGSRQNLYLFPFLRPNMTPFERHCAFDGWDSPVQMYAGRMVRSGDVVGRAKLIVCFPYSQFWFLASSRDWFRPENYETLRVDNFILYMRKEGPA